MERCGKSNQLSRSLDQEVAAEGGQRFNLVGAMGDTACASLKMGSKVFHSAHEQRNLRPRSGYRLVVVPVFCG